MLSVDQAKTAILERAKCRLASGNIALFNALRRRLAEDIYSPIDVPPADNSAMDGIALRSADCVAGHNSLAISQRIAAGGVAEPLKPGTAARIFTGAEIPEGADAVEIQENCQFLDNFVSFAGRPESGKNIRARGQDIKRGSLVLARGTLLRPQELGLLASVGIGQIKVLKKLRVGVFSTGDELVDPGTELQPGQIYNSNRYSLAGLIQESHCEFVDLGRVEDNLASTITLLKRASTEVDVIISSGGVSVGEEDHVKAAVESCGSLSLWKIAVKPGKPLAVGEVGNTPFFGLPGNPVSGVVTFLLFVRPFLRVLSGGDAGDLNWRKVETHFSRDAVTREEYLRVRLCGGRAEIYPNQSSGVLSSLSWATGLVRQNIGQNIAQNTEVDYLDFDQF